MFNSMKIVSAGILWFLLATSAVAADLPDRTEYDGYFSEVDTSSPDCAWIFADPDYKVSHFRVGPTRRTSVLHFTSSVESAFFQRKSFYGLLGGRNDLFYEEQIVRDGQIFRIKARGIIDVALAYLEFSVQGQDDTGTGICDGTATFAAFN